MDTLHEGALRALLYYDIWEHPLTVQELRLFLPIPWADGSDLGRLLAMAGSCAPIRTAGDYVFVGTRSNSIVERRQLRERHARRLWRAARAAAFVIRRFPFVRAVFVSGDLSKNSTSRESDVDFFILTEPRRLWVTRVLLTLFKKIFLFNSKKFFCLNAFRTTDDLTHQDRNFYAAAEVVYLQPLYNADLFRRYMEANAWVQEFFPNISWDALATTRAVNRRSALQVAGETLLGMLPLDRIDAWLMNRMRSVWAHRYPEFDSATRERMFRSTPTESRAYGGDFQDKILRRYQLKLREFGLEP